MALILDGKKVRDELAAQLADRVKQLPNQPQLAIIQIGDHPASNVYIKQKKIFGEKIGVKVTHHQLAENITEKEAENLIARLNADHNVNGIILQLPLPKNLAADVLIEKIAPAKDVDGLTAANVKKMWSNDESGIVPATARGVVTLLDYYQQPIARRRAVVIGRSNLVGKPIAARLLARGATVTICHRGTPDLAAATKRGDIIIVAAGRPKLLRANHVSPGQIVIDVGISRDSDDRLTGDVDFAAVAPLVAAISPVPGGVGPLTVVSLFQNLLDQRQPPNS